MDRQRPQRGSRPGSGISLLGDRLPERIRSTTLGLLGMVAAVGLAAIAIALQGDWPLVAGSPVPQPPPRHQAIGGAVALDSGPGAARSGSGSRGRRAVAGIGSRSASVPVRPSPPAAAPTAPSELVSSPATPASPPSPGSRGGSHGPSPPQAQAPSATQPQQQPAPAAASPAAESPPKAQSPPAPAPTEASPPEATVSQVPPAESNVPEWSNGQGHAWGRADEGQEPGHCHH